MYRKNYKVKGEDVDDFMVMEKVAYRMYFKLLIKDFLSDNKFSKKIIEKLKVNIDNSKEQLICMKDLMFTQDFSMYLDMFNMIQEGQKIKTKGRFFNENNELCATVVWEF